MEECQRLLGDNGRLVTKDHFCAIDPDGLRTGCNFDQGGGFIVEYEGVRYLTGVMSLITNMCRPQFPIMYMRLQGYYSWLWDYVSAWQEDSSN